MKSLFSSVVLWLLFVAGLAAGAASGLLLDGTQKSVATYAGIAVALLTGTRIAQKPKIKAFLSTRPVLWFLFLFNGSVAAICYFAVDGVQGIMAAVSMGLVSLGAGGGLLAAGRKAVRARA
ncbi:hypothetical protein ABT173_05340 [Streptomyces sp. NPDC001795]|uniref:hypothetical protein n=1 Tax=unclassified Streptomyces TaxID=2593676 RepID=UPI0033171F50